MGQEAVEPGVDMFYRFAVPKYPVPEQAVAALAAMINHGQWRERSAQGLQTFEVFQRVRGEGCVAIGDAEAREITYMRLVLD
jgi:acyl-CoA synthetase (NDP forming)